MVEVLLETNSHHLGDTDRDVDAAREVRVDLYRVKQDQEKHVNTVIRRGVAKHRLDNYKYAVGDDELFEISPKDSLQTELERLSRERMRHLKLCGKVSVSRDRTLRKLREE